MHSHVFAATWPLEGTGRVVMIKAKKVESPSAIRRRKDPSRGRKRIRPSSPDASTGATTSESTMFLLREVKTDRNCLLPLSNSVFLSLSTAKIVATKTACEFPMVFGGVRLRIKESLLNSLMAKLAIRCMKAPMVVLYMSRRMVLDSTMRVTARLETPKRKTSVVVFMYWKWTTTTTWWTTTKCSPERLTTGK